MHPPRCARQPNIWRVDRAAYVTIERVRKGRLAGIHQGDEKRGIQMRGGSGGAGWLSGESIEEWG